VDIPAWLPNWLERTDYPSPISRLEWAWQFLRRNLEYQRAWKRHIEPHYDPSEISEPIDRQRRLRRVGRVQLKETSLFLEQFRIATYPPPAPSESTAKLRFVAIRYAQKPKNRLSAYAPHITLENDEVLVVFDLAQSIEQQLGDTKELLASLPRPRPFRAALKQYQRYLRVLDAKAVGASNDDIARRLYPHLANDYPDKDGNRQVRKDLKTAKRLRDHDYWRIAIGGE
jgi:hypothetical protein